MAKDRQVAATVRSFGLLAATVLLALTPVACALASNLDEAANIDLSFSEQKMQVLKDSAVQTVGYAQQSIYPHHIQIIKAHRSEPTPVGTISHESAPCRILLNSNPRAWDYWPQIDSSVGLDMAEYFEFSLMHEIGHCFSRKELPHQGYEYPGRGRLGEAFADIFALAMLRAKYPQRNFEAVFEAMVKIRSSLASTLVHTHHTAPYLLSAKEALLSVGPEFSANPKPFLSELQRLGVLRQMQEK